MPEGRRFGTPPTPDVSDHGAAAGDVPVRIWLAAAVMVGQGLTHNIQEGRHGLSSMDKGSRILATQLLWILLYRLKVFEICALPRTLFHTGLGQARLYEGDRVAYRQATTTKLGLKHLAALLEKAHLKAASSLSTSATYLADCYEDALRAQDTTVEAARAAAPPEPNSDEAVLSMAEYFLSPRAQEAIELRLSLAIERLDLAHRQLSALVPESIHDAAHTSAEARSRAYTQHRRTLRAASNLANTCALESALLLSKSLSAADQRTLTRLCAHYADLANICRMQQVDLRCRCPGLERRGDWLYSHIDDMELSESEAQSFVRGLENLADGLAKALNVLKQIATIIQKHTQAIWEVTAYPQHDEMPRQLDSRAQIQRLYMFVPAIDLLTTCAADMHFDLHLGD